MQHVKPWQICAVAAVTLAALVPAATSASSGVYHNYANQTTYGNPKDTDVRTPPEGYWVFFLETVGRHGARSLTSTDVEKDVLELWESAEQKNALTDQGKSLASVVRQFQAVEREIGYGEQSELGRQEMRGIGRRTGANYASFFARMRKYDHKILTVTSDVLRTKQGATAIRNGLGDGLDFNPDRLFLSPLESERLQFGNRASSHGAEMIDRVRSRKSIVEHAEHLLADSYDQWFVNDLDDPVGAALDIYLLYSTAAGLQEETTINFNRYVPEADRAAMSYATDVRTFYRYGPGVKGETNTFEDARPVLKDFFERLDRRIDGGSTAAVFRVAHGETTMPFAALIKAPRSQEQTPRGEPYDRDTNPWLGSYAGRLSGNIEWTAVRNKDRKVLVTMRVHEVPVKFHSGCEPYKEGSWFYTVPELKSCLG